MSELDTFEIAHPGSFSTTIGAAELFSAVPVQAQHETPVLMVHGAFHGAWAFEPWSQLLSRFGFPSHRLGLRNHVPGLSLAPEQICSTTMDDYADDVMAAINCIGAPVILMGHSLGGLISQMAAMRAATNVKALVLIGSAGPGQLGETRDFDWPEDQPLLFPPERMRTSMFNEIDDETFAQVYRRLVPESPRALNQSGRGRVMIDPDRIMCPRLVVGTGHDGIGLHTPDRIAAYLGADCLRVTGTSHDCVAEPSGYTVLFEIIRWLMTVGAVRAGASV